MYFARERQLGGGDHMLWEILGRALPINVTVTEEGPPQVWEEDRFEWGTTEWYDAREKKRGRGKYSC